ncbi:MAG: metallophosphoesterase [Deltaproteobacteria bacterium]|nr:metallophosphoesterase [Deltaproteobacteria bacterium]
MDLEPATQTPGRSISKSRAMHGPEKISHAARAALCGLLAFVLACLSFAWTGCGSDGAADDGWVPLHADGGDAGKSDVDAHPLSDGETTDMQNPEDGSVSEAACSAGALSSMLFDGVNDGISMGVAPSLGLSTFTLEAWVRRDGPGQGASSGNGGLTLVPIISKGRGENDETVKNCNYLLGFTGEVLGADFEDMADGGNHPVVGATAVTMGDWHHVAATYDGTTYRLYLDGKLDGHSDTGGAKPRHDSAQHFGLGTALNSTGVASGRLKGALAEVRVWNTALSAATIAGNMYRTADAQTGLVGRWPLDTSHGADAAVGSVDGVITGAVLTNAGPGLDDGVPPKISGASPAGEQVPAGDVKLAVDVDDPDSEPLDVTFYTRELTSDDDFAIVVLPDTQLYSQSHPTYFTKQTQFARSNLAKYNIRAVLHNGDIVNKSSEPTYKQQWTNAVNAMKILEPKIADFPDGIPYLLAVGNHDQDPGKTHGATTEFNDHFGVDRFAGRAYYGGHYGSTNDEKWITFSAGDRDFVALSLSYDEDPDAPIIAWARSVFLQRPSSFGIFDAHSILNTGKGWTDQGAVYFNAFKTTPSVQILTCGHIHGETRRTDTVSNRELHTMLADFQKLENGGNGWLRLWLFSPAKNELHVRTHSPVLNSWQTDSQSDFKLKVNLAGAGKAAFKPLATVKNAQGHVTATLPKAKAGTTHEWYAAVNDCVHRAHTPHRRFTVAAP